MNILICASIGSQNLGDELILKNEIFLLEKQYSERFLVPKKDMKFCVFSYDPKNPFFEKDNVSYKSYFPNGAKTVTGFFKNIKNFATFIQQLIKADIVVFGGGGLIYDKEYQSIGSPLRQWELRALFCRILKKRLDFFRIGISISNSNNYASVESIFSGAEYITVRDEYSYLLLKKLGLEENVSIKKDPVFFDERANLLQNSASGRTLSRYSTNSKKDGILLGNYDSKSFELSDIKKSFEVAGINLANKSIGIAFRQLDIEGYNERVSLLLEHILQQGGQLVLIPHSFHKTDPKANDKAWLESLKGELLEQGGYSEESVQVCQDMKESYEIYVNNKIDINMAQRLHAMILSHVYDIPFIGFSYGTKTKELLSDFQK